MCKLQLGLKAAMIQMAFETISAQSNVPLYLFGDHASRHIPKGFNALGLSGDDLTRHIAWDIGTDALIRNLTRHFGCGAQLASVSRLVIDMNREPDAPGLIPIVSDGTLIPGNGNLSEKAKDERINQYYKPYHAQLSGTMHHFQGKDPLIISVHSFTPKPLSGEPRKTDIGLLVKHDEPSAKAFAKEIGARRSDLNIGLNLPYSAYDLNYTVDCHIAPHGYRHLAIEVRQDHLYTQDKIASMSALLASTIAALL